MSFLTATILTCSVISIVFLALLLDIQNRCKDEDSSIRYTHIASSALVLLLTLNYIHHTSSSIFLIELFFFYFFSISIHYISLLKLWGKKISYIIVLLVSMVISILIIIIWLEYKLPLKYLPTTHTSTLIIMTNFISIIVPGILSSLVLTINILRYKTPPSFDNVLIVCRGSFAAISSVLIQLSSERIYDISYSIMIISYSLGILSVIVLNDNYYSSLMRNSRDNKLSNASYSWEEYVKYRGRRRATISHAIASNAKNLSSYNRESKGWIYYTPVTEVTEEPDL